MEELTKKQVLDLIYKIKINEQDRPHFEGRFSVSGLTMNVEEKYTSPSEQNTYEISVDYCGERLAEINDIQREEIYPVFAEADLLSSSKPEEIGRERKRLHNKGIRLVKKLLE